MRTSMVYVLLNFRKHLNASAGIDPRSSGPHFSGWHRCRRLDSADVGSAAAATRGDLAATAAPTTWMATVGWRRAGGLLKPEERPAVPLRPRRPAAHRQGQLDSADVASRAAAARSGRPDERSAVQRHHDVTERAHVARHGRSD
jgi:hypothetical protein